MTPPIGVYKDGGRRRPEAESAGGGRVRAAQVCKIGIPDAAAVAFRGGGCGCISPLLPENEFHPQAAREKEREKRGRGREKRKKIKYLQISSRQWRQRPTLDRGEGGGGGEKDLRRSSELAEEETAHPIIPSVIYLLKKKKYLNVFYY
jgi:hypothetical protein